MAKQRVLIAGGGIVGLAAAYKLALARPGVTPVVLEKESVVGRHQTGHNSGVLHAGLYYKPGSNKARLAVTGIREMVRFCQENGIPHDICGKLVVAADESELGRLDELYERGVANGLQGLKKMGPEQMREIEPNVGGLRAVRVPEEGIVDFARVCAVMVEKIRALGGEIHTNAKVGKLLRRDGGWVAETPAGEYSGNFLINCAGLHCDRVSELAGETRSARIVPFRGEYYVIRPERRHLVRHLIYPVPDPKFPFLGVHFTRLIHGGVEAGPNAVLALRREGYKKTDFSLRDSLDALLFPGLWRFLARYPSMCWWEIRRSFSRQMFCESLQKLVPAIQPEDLSPGGSGVRAQALTPSGELVQDFLFVESNKALHVLNAPSPGATASLAIGSEIAAKVTL